MFYMFKVKAKLFTQGLVRDADLFKLHCKMTNCKGWGGWLGYYPVTYSLGRNVFGVAYVEPTDNKETGKGWLKRL